MIQPQLKKQVNICQIVGKFHSLNFFNFVKDEFP